MSKTNIITGVDIGTGNIKILVANKEPGEEKLQVVSQVRENSSGVRKGVVVDVEEVSNILQDSFSRIDEEVGFKISSVYINVDGSHLFSLFSRGTIAVSRADRKISEEDIQRVLQAAQTISLPSNKEIFDIFPKEFIIDGQSGIKTALGLEGVRLEAEVLVLGGFSPYLKNLSQAVSDSGLQILATIPSPIASARAVLTPRQKELGAAVLDIGAGTSGLAVFEEGDLIHFAILPIGSSNITNDIAIGLKVDVDVAERIKIEYGSHPQKRGKKGKGPSREKIEIEDLESVVFSRKALNEIIEARISEIYGEVQKELKKIAREKLLPAGIVLTGGGAKLPNIVELAKKELKLPCKIGKPQGFSDLEEDLSFSTVCGLVLEGADLIEEESQPALGEFGKGIGNKIKKAFKIFLP